MNRREEEQAERGPAGADSDIRVSRLGGRVLQISLHRPDRRNALREQTLDELTRALQAALADEKVRAVLLSGEGPDFCAGADIQEFRESLERPILANHAATRRLADLLRLGGEYTKPLVAAVQGRALGGALGLVTMCHLVVAAEGARFGATELRVGMFPMVIMPLLRRAVGERRALEMSLTARVLPAREALQIGLVERVVPDGDLAQAAQNLAEEVARWSPVAVGLGLAGVNESRDMPWDRALYHLAALRQVIQKSEDLREGAAAFFERRPPRWHNR